MRTSPAGKIRFEPFTAVTTSFKLRLRASIFSGSNVNLDLPVRSSVRLRYRRALHIRNLITHLELSKILKAGLVQSLTLQSYQAHGLG